MMEHRSEPLLSRRQFARRLARVFAITLGIVAVSAGAGTFGYRFFFDLPWSEAFHRACLVLGEQHHGQVPESTGGRIFDSLYVMYARLVFFSILALLTLPLLHRLLHRLHLDPPEERDAEADGDRQ